MAVRRYLEALEANKPRRGRKRTPESMQKRLDFIQSELAYVDALTHLHYLQEQKNLEAQLSRSTVAADIGPLERQFIRTARAYGQRKGITYSTWRASGVSAEVLRKAGIAPTRG